MYDVIVIGAGPGGYSAALNAAKSGLKTLIVEKNSVGGVCLNEGCIPTKTLLYSAKLADGAREGKKYGVIADGVRVEHDAVLRRKNKVVRTLTAGIKSALKTSGAEFAAGNAVIERHEDEACYIGVNGVEYAAKNVVIATGSSPVLPEIAGLKEALENGFALTSKELLDLSGVPSELVVIGGGVVGLEFASYFNSIGSKVTVVEMADKIAGSIDGDIANALLKAYSKKGVEFALKAKVTEIGCGGVVYEKDGAKYSIKADKVLAAIGRKPNTKELGLDRIGVEYDGGGIKTNEWCRTNVDNIYAIGDVNGKVMLAHTAYREADVCIGKILGGNDSVDYGLIPAVIYTNPETASVGETEESALSKGLEYSAVKIPMRFSGRYLAENEGGDGFCKILTEKNTHRLIGVHIIANYASEIIFGAAMMIQNKMKVSDIRSIVFPHPTVSEIFRDLT